MPGDRRSGGLHVGSESERRAGHESGLRSQACIRFPAVCPAESRNSDGIVGSQACAKLTSGFATLPILSSAAAVVVAVASVVVLSSIVSGHHPSSSRGLYSRHHHHHYYLDRHHHGP
eukprot:2722092-Rhodomonas_salina.1